MSTKHTPGPWTVVDNYAGLLAIVDQSSEVVARVYGERNPVLNKDARLIAAAPELLEALQLVLNDNRLMNAMNRQQARTVE